MEILLRGPFKLDPDGTLVRLTDAMGQRIYCSRDDFFGGMVIARRFEQVLGSACSATLIPACEACQKRPKH